MLHVVGLGIGHRDLECLLEDELDGLSLRDQQGEEPDIRRELLALWR